MTTTAVDHRLTEAERESLERDGYVLREGVFTREEVADIAAACEALVNEVVAHRKPERRRYHVGSYTFDPDALTGCTIKWEGDSDEVHGLEPFAHLSPPLEKWAYDARFIGPSIDFVDDDEPTLFTEKLNLKRPRVGGKNPWHQDIPYWETWVDEPDAKVTAMLFLDDSSLENGTLEVIPGSHTTGKWKTRTDSDVFGNLEMDPTETEGKPVVAVEVVAGSVLFFGPYLVHKSNPNTSDKPRRTLLYTYQPKRCRSGLVIQQQERAERKGS